MTTVPSERRPTNVQILSTKEIKELITKIQLGMYPSKVREIIGFGPSLKLKDKWYYNGDSGCEDTPTDLVIRFKNGVVKSVYQSWSSVDSCERE
jgi:hypothetical protein